MSFFTLDDSLPFPKEGIKLSSLELFINECGGRSVLEGLSTTDVNEKHQMRLTSDMKSSYCDYLKTRDSSRVGEATMFICLAWKSKFLDVVDTLQYHFRDSPDVIMWFDLFSKNQHTPPNLDFHWWNTTYKSAIKHFNRTVIIWSPWNDPIPLTRAWCLFEIYCTIECDCKFEIAMSPSDKRDFLKAIKEDATVTINTMLATVDVRKSESADPNIKISVLKTVESTVGIDGINCLVFERLRDWVIHAVKESLQDARTAEECASLQLSLGILHSNQGDYENAENHIKESLATRENMFVECHTDSCKSMCSLAALYQRMGKYKEALPLYTKCLEMRKSPLDDKHLDTLVFKNGLASLYECMGKYDEALPLYKKCLAKRNEALGEKHPHALASMNAIATLYQSMTRYEEALPLCTKCLAIRKEVLGEDHPDTLVSINSLASVYKAMGENKKALPLFTKCLYLREKVLGDKHPDVLVSMNALALLFRCMTRYDESLFLYSQCLPLMKEVLGDKHRDTLDCLYNLALLHENMGRKDESMPLKAKHFYLEAEVQKEKGKVLSGLYFTCKYNFFYK